MGGTTCHVRLPISALLYLCKEATASMPCHPSTRRLPAGVVQRCCHAASLTATAMLRPSLPPQGSLLHMVRIAYMPAHEHRRGELGQRAWCRVARPCWLGGRGTWGPACAFVVVPANFFGNVAPAQYKLQSGGGIAAVSRGWHCCSQQGVA
jgi:hypothetical protein